MFRLVMQLQDMVCNALDIIRNLREKNAKLEKELAFWESQSYRWHYLADHWEDLYNSRKNQKK